MLDLSFCMAMRCILPLCMSCSSAALDATVDQGTKGSAALSGFGGQSFCALCLVWMPSRPTEVVASPQLVNNRSAEDGV